MPFDKKAKQLSVWEFVRTTKSSFISPVIKLSLHLSSHKILSFGNIVTQLFVNSFHHYLEGVNDILQYYFKIEIENPNESFMSQANNLSL